MNVKAMAEVSSPWTLSIEDIRRRLIAPPMARQLYIFGQVSSTNAALRQFALSGAPEGTVVLADAQAAGRGRMGQPWFSPAGVNLYAWCFRGPLSIAGHRFPSSPGWPPPTRSRVRRAAGHQVAERRTHRRPQDRDSSADSRGNGRVPDPRRGVNLNVGQDALARPWVPATTATSLYAAQVDRSIERLRRGLSQRPRAVDDRSGRRGPSSPAGAIGMFSRAAGWRFAGRASPSSGGSSGWMSRLISSCEACSASTV
jgi:hypothetical protein